ncbi:Bromodomain adjacent to zinc finger domain protein 1A [Eumeta japonica]|uniref:Bromodomain adjacent to zinc finger domain protein 1A n=1 Tax=Eumeta variegata TaxID=151549 RepID=A0A4C1V263_EUMVA|nr:Bromodomain adjacent to zinc finger domain protein 1A [Eumeta japonica]
MPLLKRKAFEKSSAFEFLRDDDEVFHCEITDEIFKDYEEYCERIILVNSMVWTCEMTGKNNLTYAEALESEKAARRSLKNFPTELRIPILYLAALTKRCSFAEMSEDVFNYVRDRYFVGETVEACLEGDTWHDAHILSVNAPKQHPDSDVVLQPSAYCYEVEQFDDIDASTPGQVAIASHDRVRRHKGIYTRDKNRLFLKQFVEQGPGGVIIIKESALQKYNIAKTSFDQIFFGAPPDFPSSKRFIKNSLSPPKNAKSTPNKLNKTAKKPSPDKKGRQESMDKFVKKSEKPGERSGVNKTKSVDTHAAKASAMELVERMRRAEDQLKQRKLEEKEKKKEKNARLQAYLKEWQKVKDDLDLEDHKVIPKGTPIEIEGLPSKYIGDFLSELEFVHLNGETLKAKDVFHTGLHAEMFRKALTEKEYAGVFSDLIQMLLTTIFSLQEDEADEYNEKGSIAVSTDHQGDMGVNKAIELATKACKWSQTYLGTPLRKLPLDATTVSEVLRLHLLSSGAAPGPRCATWRYQQRGGYSCADDAGVRLRLDHPHVVRHLGSVHVADLPLDDKFKVLQCLMNQILSYATIRDIIEEKLETLRTTKHELRSIQISDRKREVEQMAARQKLRKAAAAKKEDSKTADEKLKVDEDLKTDLEKLAKEGELKKAEVDKKIKELQVQCFDYQSYIGMDRAYRRYMLNQCVPGLFVEWSGDNVGVCHDKPVLPAAPRGDDVMAYVRALFEKERAGSDKENESGANSRGNSPKKPLSNLNGLTQKLNGLDNDIQNMRDLLMCTGNINTCLVHSPIGKPTWYVYSKDEEIEALIQSLNKRGVRETELRQNLELDKNSIVEYIKKCPLYVLNVNLRQPFPALPSAPNTRNKKIQPSLVVPPDSTLSEALEISLRDYILELEEKVFLGCLGALKVKDREAWRGTIMLKSYDKQAEYLSWGPNRQYRDDYHLPNGQLKMPQDKDKAQLVSLPKNTYRDPAFYLGEESEINGIKSEPGQANTEPSQEVVRDLASALLQVSQSIHSKYLERPLGLNDKERKEREAKGKALEFDALERWEVSLMESRSYSQILLHLFTLDSSIIWSASIQYASCKICRRKKDPDNMLLCDGCNKGHHLYCLKPKLAKVPDGDWFCEQCRPKEKTPRKKRKLFSDDDIEEPMDVSNEYTDDDINYGLCAACGSGGRLANTCSTCAQQYHHECAKPRARSNARKWVCANCLAPPREMRRCAATAMNNIHQYTRALCNSRIDSSDNNNPTESEDSDDNTVLTKLKLRRSRASKDASPITNGLPNEHEPAKRGRRSKEDTRRSRKSGTPSSRSSVTLRIPVDDQGEFQNKGAKKSPRQCSPVTLRVPVVQSSTDNEDMKKHKRSSSRVSTPLILRIPLKTKESDDSDEETLVQLKGRGLRAGTNATLVNGTTGRKSKNNSFGDNSKKMDTYNDESRHKKRIRVEELLHVAELERLLDDVMRHKDSWPFCEPVDTNEVPDYLNIISHPMDLGTMRQNLAAGRYDTDEQFMDDARLVFANCYTYNKEAHIVARAGVRLEKYFQKRCQELDLMCLPDIYVQEDDDTSSKASDDMPHRAKKPRAIK